MPEKRVVVETAAYTVTLPVDVVAMIESLIGGVWGASRAEVTRTLVNDQLKLLLSQGIVKLPRTPKSPETEPDG